MPEFRVAFVAGDYAETVGFFTDVMGLDVLRSFEGDQPGTILVAADGQIEVFAPGAEPASPVSGVSLAWEVDDAVTEHEKLVAAGADIVRPPQLQPWGHNSFVVGGPDGWTITLYEIVRPQ